MRKGFTLIELLVVVLIIGILAAIAVPQYKRVVVRSKMAQLFIATKSLANSIERYIMITGTKPGKWADLDTAYPELAGANNQWVVVKDVIYHYDNAVDVMGTCIKPNKIHSLCWEYHYGDDPRTPYQPKGSYACGYELSAPNIALYQGVCTDLGAKPDDFITMSGWKIHKVN